MSAAYGAIIQPFSLSARSGAEKPSDAPFKTPFFSSTSFLPKPSKILISRPPPSSSSSGRVHVSAVPAMKKSKVNYKFFASDLLITREEGLELYQDMVLGRSFTNMCTDIYLFFKYNFHGLVHLYNTKEAVSTGFIKLLKKEDSVCSSSRDHIHALSKGVSARALMAVLFGSHCHNCQGGSMHIVTKDHKLLSGFAFIGEGPGDNPVDIATFFSSDYSYVGESNPNDTGSGGFSYSHGTPIPASAAFDSMQRRREGGDCDHVTVAFFGDEACNNGQFFECLNFAALWKLPMVFVVENNLWAIGMSHLRVTSNPEIWKKGSAFGMPEAHVDGMDVLKVREVAKETIARARRGDGPTLVVCQTYWFRGHSLADPDKLHPDAEKASYAARDPITALKEYIIENNLASESELKAIDKKIDDVIEDAVECAGARSTPSTWPAARECVWDGTGVRIYNRRSQV